MAARITIFNAQAIREAVQATVDERTQVANEIAAEARAAAPVLTGEYRNGIGVEVSGTTVQVVDNDPTSGFKEYGTSDTPAHAVLTDAARRRGRYSGIQPGRR
ncbi:HK97 gp10 family phage protein [Crossiella sp. CA-258035]|uniref:HK97 gp10 family phage protein n=1 Tax=Crossiella sp. CA-258035 TaxID=2981138 RepID=UPI0024BCC12F|nr:HK97 gp10 family phage protein [Crossiella sp. CA-258035]WHT21019.1 HK97 gp10 family phage protein [Crossiella sp. CA-258035]